MKKVLYLTNIEVPYRVRFFNELAKKCDLTVLYERYKSVNRNELWTKGENSNYKKIFLDGINIKNEYSFSLKIIKEIFNGYDVVVVGCYNSPVQMLAIIIMKLFNINYFLNLDGEVFINNNSLKNKIKLFFLKGARKYLVAGICARESLKKIFPHANIISYFFSSLFESEIICNAKKSDFDRNQTILVVGQYFDYKGMDIALEVAKLNPDKRFKFIGMGSRTDLFISEHNLQGINNIEIIPFLQKEKLEEEYMTCKMLVLPSRQECWGLVVNEAASFGTPIVSTYGSGAAVEFLGDKYEMYLARTNNPKSLSDVLCKCFKADNSNYIEYLLEKSKDYSIERNVSVHIEAFTD